MYAFAVLLRVSARRDDVLAEGKVDDRSLQNRRRRWPQFAELQAFSTGIDRFRGTASGRDSSSGDGS